MKPRIKLNETKTASGGVMALYEHDGDFSINFNGQELMHSKACASETLLGELGVEHISTGVDSRVLIGGLGLGFTLRSVLNGMDSDGVVEVVELIPDVVDWNRDHLQALNGRLLDDPRVITSIDDVTPYIRKAKQQSYDAILLDIDNGPVALVAENNASLYSKSGVRTIRSALKPKGRAIFWSASPDKKFEERLRRANFKVSAVPAKVHEGAKRASYTLYVAERTEPTESIN